ncbi:hypothetical protein H4219_001939 [Mycoemilia scoparia]|uniref:Distal membrane-arm assembly complex protein 1-like domain-containing protein n=1 Tax=Mycoemilia scoparia TaxID=417184 RepID=A0A9W7ZZ07_9FUNG|nr:hypothetical protein H4219_001939 [Mycoemilia scoparia]
MASSSKLNALRKKNMATQSNDSGDTSSSSNSHAKKFNDDNSTYEDCLGCRLVGAAAFGGLAGYTLYQRSQLSKANYAGRRAGLLVFSAGKQ